MIVPSQDDIFSTHRHVLYKHRNFLKTSSLKYYSMALTPHFTRCQERPNFVRKPLGILILRCKATPLAIRLALSSKLLEPHKSPTCAHRIWADRISIARRPLITRHARRIVRIARRAGCGRVIVVATVIVVASSIVLAESARETEDDGCKQKAS